MRIEFYEPEGSYDAHAVCDMLTLAGVALPAATIATWTDLERIMAYDWAAREHMRASDNDRIMHRPKPWFVTQAEELAKQAATQPGSLSAAHAASREIILKHAALGVSPHQILTELQQDYGLGPQRESLHRYLAADQANGLVERTESGWKATEKLAKQATP